MTKFPEDNFQFWEGIYLEDDAGWDLGGATPIFDSMADSISPGKVCINSNIVDHWPPRYPTTFNLRKIT